MSLKKLVTVAALVVGSSTAALAQPYHSNTRSNVVVRDHRDTDWQWSRNHRKPVVVKPQVRWYESASYSVQPTYYNEPVYTAPVYQPPVYQPPVYEQPSLTLMAPSELGSRFDLNTINELAGKSTIRLDATGCEGSTYIDKVTIYNVNGGYQQITVGQWLSAANPTFDIGLTFGAQTARVIVDGHSQAGGTLAVEAV